VRRTAPDGKPQVTLCTQVVQRTKRRGKPAVPSGATLVFEGTGRLRYAIKTTQVPAQPAS